MVFKYVFDVNTSEYRKYLYIIQYKYLVKLFSLLTKKTKICAHIDGLLKVNFQLELFYPTVQSLNKIILIIYSNR